MKSLESKYWALYRLHLVLVLTLATNSIAAQNLIKSATASIRFSKKDRSKWNPYKGYLYLHADGT